MEADRLPPTPRFPRRQNLPIPRENAGIGGNTARGNRFAARNRAKDIFDANGRKDVPMQRMCSAGSRTAFLLCLFLLADAWSNARGDLIRSVPGRSFPDIAGDIVGAQTYTYDPMTQTGMFKVVNAPHLISLGPSVKDMVHMRPDADGTLSQMLKMRLDRNGRLVNSPDNTFQIRGSVVIGDKTYQGLLLEGKPTAFGADVQETTAAKKKSPEVFDLNMEITGGQLAQAFGKNAYLRIVPQDGTTFNGEFTVDFASERPLTNLRSARGKLPENVPEPTTLLTLLTFGAGAMALRVRRHFRRTSRRRSFARGAIDGHRASVPTTVSRRSIASAH